MTTDAFDRVLPNAARAAEMLDAETEGQLARAWRDQRDERALHRLITAYMRLAISMASKYRRYGAPMSDLIQEASLGLMKAAEKFDPDRGVRFSSYAMWWIKASIQDYVLRNFSMVRIGSTSGQKSLFFNMKRVQAGLVRAAREEGVTLDAHQLREQVAMQIGVSMAEVALMEGRLSGGDASLNLVQGGEPEGREWIEILEDEAPQAAELFELSHDHAQMRRQIAAAMAGLSARERLIVTGRQLSEVPRTLADLAAELGLSKERVRQLEAAAYGKLKAALLRDAPEVMALFAH